MIDWNSETWGNRVHVSATGSWVPDRHDVEHGPAETPAEASETPQAAATPGDDEAPDPEVRGFGPSRLSESN